MKRTGAGRGIDGPVQFEQPSAGGGQAARAAPKIQLVIALVLVPAVLLLVVAVLVANADRLIGAAFGQG